MRLHGNAMTVVDGFTLPMCLLPQCSLHVMAKFEMACLKVLEVVSSVVSMAVDTQLFLTVLLQQLMASGVVELWRHLFASQKMASLLLETDGGGVFRWELQGYRPGDRIQQCQLQQLVRGCGVALSEQAGSVTDLVVFNHHVATLQGSAMPPQRA